MQQDLQMKQAITIIEQGGVIAYPTESVYGLGCDPFNQQAVKKLLELKQRSISKGLIVIAANWQQVQLLALPISEQRLEQIFTTPSEATTWVFPASNQAPDWITGDFETIALRITNHPLAKQLCELAGPLVSTSANISNHASTKNSNTVKHIFGDQVDFIVEGECGDLSKPTSIIDAISGDIFRH